LDSAAINQAIDAAAAAGGGTVYFPAGTYLSGSIRLKSHITLDLGAGSTILGAANGTKAYDAPETNQFDQYQDYGHDHWHNSLIWGENLEDIAIVGQGTINGGGMTRGSGNLAVPAGDGDKSIALKLCHNVNLQNINMAHGGHFAILLTGCDNVGIQNLKIDTDRDGMDIDCCRNVRVTDCTVNSPNDDAICPKSSYALGYFRPTEDVTITGCMVSGYAEGSVLDGTYKTITKEGGGPTGRIKCGTESSGGFKNISIANCVFDHCRGLALEAVDGGSIDGISAVNLTMRNCGNSPIFIRLGARLRSPEGTPVGVVRNINIDNVVVVGADTKLASIIAGIPDHDIENVHLSNIRIVADGGGKKDDAAVVPPEQVKGYPDPRNFGQIPAYGFFCRHVKGITFENVDVAFQTPDARPAFVLDDVTDATFDLIKAQRADDGLATFQLQDVKNFSLGNSPGMQPQTGSYTETTRF
jgi:polygalacturonase